MQGSRLAFGDRRHHLGVEVAVRRPFASAGRELFAPPRFSSLKTTQAGSANPRDTQMHDERSFSHSYLEYDRSTARPPSLWQRIVGGVVMLGVFALALTVSVALFAVVLTVGAIVWGYLWWKTRDLRKAMREHMNARPPDGGVHTGREHEPGGPRGVIIDGEVVREDRGGGKDPR